MLVRRGDRAAADAGRWRGLPVPGLFKEDGGVSCKRAVDVTIALIFSLWPGLTRPPSSLKNVFEG
jgi:hypothetical protein